MLGWFGWTSGDVPLIRLAIDFQIIRSSPLIESLEVILQGFGLQLSQCFRFLFFVPNFGHFFLLSLISALAIELRQWTTKSSMSADRDLPNSFASSSTSRCVSGLM